MPSISIYGHSDDIIVVRGYGIQIPGVGEYSPNKDDEGWLELSTGDVFKVSYRGGVWLVEKEPKTNSGLISFTHAMNSGAESKRYSDTLAAEGPIQWVRFHPKYPITNGSRIEAIAHYLEVDGRQLVSMPSSLLHDLYAWIIAQP